MKKSMTVVICCFAISALIVLVPEFLFKNQNNEALLENKNSLISQEIIEYSDEPKLQNKLYYNDQLIGIVSDVNWLYRQIDNLYHEKYEAEFPDTELTLGQDTYLTSENAYYQVANNDQEIFDYLVKNDLLGLKTTAIEFSTREGVYEIIYIDDIEDFYEAREHFLLNFISEESLNAIRNGEDVEISSDYGTIETGMRIAQTIVSKNAVAKPSEIFTKVSDIYEFLCYGRNKKRTYHTVREGETLQGVGYNYNNLSPLQIMMLNQDKIFSVDQVLTPGMTLNVTYFDSPITVYVTKERLTQEIIVPETPRYVENPDMYTDETFVISDEANGLENVLYEEVWENGVLKTGVVRSRNVILEPVQAVIEVGTIPIPNVGTGNFLWPIDNPRKTCLWGCYVGHQALDIESMYDRWGNVYAADNGTVVDVSFDSMGGNHITIDHNNGYMTYYGHFAVEAFPKVGETVRRGQIIGQIGETGYATGPHVHFAIYVDGVLVDPCTIVNCALIP